MKAWCKISGKMKSTKDLAGKIERTVSFCMEKAREWEKIENEIKKHVHIVTISLQHIEAGLSASIKNTELYKWMPDCKSRLAACIMNEIEGERKKICANLKKLSVVCQEVVKRCSVVDHQSPDGRCIYKLFKEYPIVGAYYSKCMELLEEVVQAIQEDYFSKQCAVEFLDYWDVNKITINQWKALNNPARWVNLLPATETIRNENSTAQEECSNCHLLIDGKDMKPHQQYCRANSLNKGPQHLDKVQAATTAFEMEVIELNEEHQRLLRLPCKFKLQIFLHPSSMKKYGIMPEEYLICSGIKNSENERIFSCSPLGVVPPSKAAVPFIKNVLGPSVDKCIYIRRFSDICVGELDMATELCIECDIPVDFLSTKRFADYIHKIFDGSVMKKGYRFTICYLGSWFEVRVKWVKGVETKYSRALNTTDCDSLVEQFADMNVGGDRPEKQQGNITTHSYYLVVESTHIVVQNVKKYTPKNLVLFQDISGLHNQLHLLKTLLYAYFPAGNIIDDDCLLSGILFSGPSGTGKSLVCAAIHNECKVPCISISVNKCKGPSSMTFAYLQKKFQEAVERAPSLIIMEEIDELCATNDAYLVQELCKLLDTLPKSPGKKVVFIATAERPEQIKTGILRPGRLEKNIHFTVPSSEEKADVLQKHMQENLSDTLKEIVEVTHGYTYSDLESIVNECAFESLCFGISGVEKPLSYSLLRKAKHKKPHSMTDRIAKIPKVRWTDIGGMEEVKLELQDMVQLSLKHSQELSSLGIATAHGILLFGPPGCCKTMIAQALATETHCNFLSVKGPELFNQYVGESEQEVSRLFQRARSYAPCIIFFDEIDSLASHRGCSSGGSNVESRVLAQLLIEIDGIDVMKNVFIVAATNRPDLIDPALLRPGRFDRVIYVPLPNETERLEILKLSLQNMPVGSEVDVAQLVEATTGYSGAEITAVCAEAAREVIYRDVTSETSEVRMTDLMAALKSYVPRTQKEQVESYEQYKRIYCH